MYLKVQVLDLNGRTKMLRNERHLSLFEICKFRNSASQKQRLCAMKCTDLGGKKSNG
jgi:hypothetical protein